MVTGIKVLILVGAINGCFAQYKLMSMETELNSNIKILSKNTEDLNKKYDKANEILSKIANRDISELKLKSTIVTATAYTARKEECDAEPNIMADGTVVYIGAVAISRDMRQKFGIKLGDTIIIKGMGSFVVRDIMNKRFKNKIDILVPTVAAAKMFGVKKLEIFYFS